jgi:hypothetical protein
MAAGSLPCPESWVNVGTGSFNPLEHFFPWPLVFSHIQELISTQPITLGGP